MVKIDATTCALAIGVVAAFAVAPVVRFGLRLGFLGLNQGGLRDKLSPWSAPKLEADVVDFVIDVPGICHIQYMALLVSVGCSLFLSRRIKS